MDTHKPWYQLPAVQGIIVILVSRLLAYTKLSTVIPAVMGVDLVNTGLEALTAAGALWIARELKNPPTTMTLTKAGAELANAITKEGTSNAQPVQPIPPVAPVIASSDSNTGAPAPKP
jgi:hypothetical protein